jgi:hypothetical protein
MKKILSYCLLLLIIHTNSSQVFAWGFFAHKRINELAVFTLPPEIFGFYKLNIEYISAHAPDPDKRRYMIPEEGARHYLDADHYEKALPLDTIPRKWEDAVLKYGEDTLMKHGICPWYLEVMLKRLTFAFKNKDLYKIIRYSTDMGHYVGDLNVPLHTTGNYNGQLTNQHGIHGLWESRIPELFASGYDFLVGQAEYLDSPSNHIWQAFEKSHSLVNDVLSIELKVSEDFSEEKKFSFEQRGATTLKVYSQKFSDAYHNALNNMQQEQMRSAIKLLGSLWYTAWVNAGQPDLNDVKQKIQAPTEVEQEKKEVEKNYSEGTILGRPEDN